jgi:hypothetical protein
MGLTESYDGWVYLKTISDAAGTPWENQILAAEPVLHE